MPVYNPLTGLWEETVEQILLGTLQPAHDAWQLQRYQAGILTVEDMQLALHRALETNITAVPRKKKFPRKTVKCRLPDYL